MKTREDVERRLRKLLGRYRQRHVQEKTARTYLNCVHNYEHRPNELPYSRSQGLKAREAEESEMAPTHQVTLLVLREEAPVHICMYGSDGKEWPGDLCDEADARAPDCPWFKRRTSEEEANAEFAELMSDVEYVFHNHKDVAALQWVLDIRDPSEVPDEPEAPPTLWERFLQWFRGSPTPQLPPPSDEEPVTEPKPEVPKGLWDADSQNSPP